MDLSQYKTSSNGGEHSLKLKIAASKKMEKRRWHVAQGVANQMHIALTACSDTNNKIASTSTTHTRASLARKCWLSHMQQYRAHTWDMRKD
jgi:hypothetical protein